MTANECNALLLLVSDEQRARSSSKLAKLAELTIEIDDLPGLALGKAFATKIVIDADASGRGWFVDETLGDDAEFESKSGQLVATNGSPATGKYDLLTTVMHEIGHVVGLDDLDPSIYSGDLMSGSIETGIRRLPDFMDFEAQSAFTWTDETEGREPDPRPGRRCCTRKQDSAYGLGHAAQRCKLRP